MSRPQLDEEDSVYLEALCAMTGESKHGAIARAIRYACKMAWCKPGLTHYEALAKKRLSELRSQGRSSLT